MPSKPQASLGRWPQRRVRVRWICSVLVRLDGYRLFGDGKGKGDEFLGFVAKERGRRAGRRGRGIVNADFAFGLLCTLLGGLKVE